MLCEKCKQNPATVHYQQNINGQLTEYHLCEHCANEMELTPSFDNMFDNSFFNDSFFNDNMFKGFLNGFSSPLSISGSKQSSSSLTCPSCGFSFNDIQQQGKFGCADCYKTFSNQIDSILKNIQANNQHNGKFPQKSGTELRVKHEIESLKLKLQKAIENEQYEEAAQIRDKIKELERGE